MKKIIFSALLAIFALSAMAQEQRQRPNPEQRAENQLKLMTEKLDLTNDQQEKIRTLNKERSKRMQESRSSRDRDQIRTFQQQYRAEVSKILTPEQKEKYEAWEKEQQQNRAEDFKKGPRQGRAPRQ